MSHASTSSAPKDKTGAVTPCVCIGMPVYNAQNHLESAVNSILKQTFHDFELIISDNCSTDATPEIVRSFMQRDDRVRYYRHQRNIGANGNFNHTFLMCQSELFKWAAHDDILAPTYLESCVQLLGSDVSFVMAHTDCALIDAQGKLLVPGESDLVENGRFVRLGIDPPERKLGSRAVYDRFSAIIMETRWCLEIFGLFRSEVLRKTTLLLPFYGADKLLLAQLAMMGRIGIVPKPLFFNRRHAEQSLSKVTLREQEEWTNPRHKCAGIRHRWLRFRGQMLAVLLGRHTFGDRVACLGVVLRYYIRFQRFHDMILEMTGFRVRRRRRELERLMSEGQSS